MNVPRPSLVQFLAIVLSFHSVSPLSTSPLHVRFRGSSSSSSSSSSTPTSSLPLLSSTFPDVRSRPQHQQHHLYPQSNQKHPVVSTATALAAGSQPAEPDTAAFRWRHRRLGYVRPRQATSSADSSVGEADQEATNPRDASVIAPASSIDPGADAPARTENLAAAKPVVTRAAGRSSTSERFFPLSDGPTFRELFSGRLPDWLIARLEELGFGSPTLVQRQALEVILDEAKNDAVLHAQTGSGKTLAFLLPLFVLIDPTHAAVQGLVVVPTRELGLQVAGVAKRIAAATGNSTKGKVQIMSVLDGSSNKRQRAWAWADPPHIVIGNPENLSKLVSNGAIRVNAVTYVVVDEVDACLLSEATRASLHELLARCLSPTHSDEDAENEEDAAKLASLGVSRVTGAVVPVSRKPKNRQTVFASATVPQHNHFIRQCVQRQWTLQEPVHVQVHAKEAMPPSLSHFYVVCPAEKKLPVLRALIKRELGALGDTRGLVFSLPSKPLEAIALSIDKALGGSKRDTLDGDSSEPLLAECLREELGLNARADTMSLFREGKTRLLVSTDMAARGLDVPEITHVFNLDLPVDGEGYVHRGGRAGRLGRPGKVISIVTPAQDFVIRRLGNVVGVNIKRINLGSSKKKPKAEPASEE